MKKNGSSVVSSGLKLSVGRFVLLLPVLSVLAAPPQDEVRPLTPGASVEREIAGGQAHSYLIALVAGQYLRLEILAPGIQPDPQLFAPDSATATGAYSYPTSAGLRTVSLIAAVAGNYRLVIRLPDAAARSGHYAVRIVEQRQATERDQLLVAAEQAEMQGRQAGYNSAADTRQSMAVLEQARRLWQQLGDRRGEERILAMLVGRAKSQSDYEGAGEYARQGRLLAQALGDRYQEANFLMTLGLMARNRGEIQQGIDHYLQARRIFASLSARMGEAMANGALGETYLELGEPELALEYLKQAEPVAAQTGFVSFECLNLNTLGAAYRASGDLPKALEYHERALALARKSGDAEDEANSLFGTGETYRLLGDYRQATDCYLAVRQIAQHAGFRLGEATALKLRGDLALLSGDEPQARECLLRSLEIFRQIGEHHREAVALRSLAQLSLAQGNLSAAREQLEAALKIEESFRARISAGELRQSWFAASQNTFALYIELLMRLHEQQPTQGFDMAALQISERSRARNLLDLLAEAGTDIRQGVAPDLLERERRLQQRINARDATRIALLGNKRTEKQAEAIQQEITELTAQYQEVEAQIRQSGPRYAALTQPQPLTVSEIQQQVLDADTLLLEYSPGKKHSYLWVVSRDTLHSFTLAGVDEITTATRRWLSLLPRSTQRKYQRETELAAAELSRLILQPAAQYLNRKRWLIVADGILQYVPFAALPEPAVSRPLSVVQSQLSVAGHSAAQKQHPTTDDGQRTTDNQPLIADHEIISLPSASVLAVLRDELRGRKTAEKQLAVFSDPVFQANDPRVQSAGTNGVTPPLRTDPGSASPAQRALTRSAEDAGLTRFERLAFTRQEAEAITALIPQAQSLKALDFTASRSQALHSQLEKYRIIHFATHGLLNSRHPELSGVVLSLVDEKGQAQDGFLRLNDLYNLKLNADLVVLSACRTALGKEVRGEGLVGLTRGLMYAGAARVVASLWNVNDEATAELMKRFYRAMLVDRQTPAAALRSAQLALSRDRRWSAPWYWSGFILQGEWK
ncbi:MAG: CHAT domain-containing tetratricopeptide repeat protein [Blastocatellia bacterium]